MEIGSNGCCGPELTAAAARQGGDPLGRRTSASSCILRNAAECANCGFSSKRLGDPLLPL